MLSMSEYTQAMDYLQYLQNNCFHTKAWLQGLNMATDLKESELETLNNQIHSINILFHALNHAEIK